MEADPLPRLCRPQSREERRFDASDTCLDKLEKPVCTLAIDGAGRGCEIPRISPGGAGLGRTVSCSFFDKPPPSLSATNAPAQTHHKSSKKDDLRDLPEENRPSVLRQRNSQSRLRDRDYKPERSEQRHYHRERERETSHGDRERGYWEWERRRDRERNRDGRERERGRDSRERGRERETCYGHREREHTYRSRDHHRGEREWGVSHSHSVQRESSRYGYKKDENVGRCRPESWPGRRGSLQSEDGGSYRDELYGSRSQTPCSVVSEASYSPVPGVDDESSATIQESSFKRGLRKSLKEQGVKDERNEQEVEKKTQNIGHTGRMKEIRVGKESRRFLKERDTKIAGVTEIKGHDPAERDIKAQCRKSTSSPSGIGRQYASSRYSVGYAQLGGFASGQTHLCERTSLRPTESILGDSSKKQGASSDDNLKCPSLQDPRSTPQRYATDGCPPDLPFRRSPPQQQICLPEQRPQQICPLSRQISPQTQLLAPQPQQITFQSQHLVPQPQQITFQSQQIAPQPQQITSQPQQIPTQTQQIPPQPISPQPQETAPQTQQICPQPQQIDPQSQQASLQPNQQICPQSPQIVLQLPQICPQPQQMNPQSQQIAIQPQQICPQSQQIISQAQQIAAESQQIISQPQQICPQPEQIRLQQQGIYPQQQSQQIRLQQQPQEIYPQQQQVCPQPQSQDLCRQQEREIYPQQQQQDICQQQEREIYSQQQQQDICQQEEREIYPQQQQQDMCQQQQQQQDIFQQQQQQQDICQQQEREIYPQQQQQDICQQQQQHTGISQQEIFTQQQQIFTQQQPQTISSQPQQMYSQQQPIFPQRQSQDMCQQQEPQRICSQPVPIFQMGQEVQPQQDFAHRFPRQSCLDLPLDEYCRPSRPSVSKTKSRKDYMPPHPCLCLLVGTTLPTSVMSRQGILEQEQETEHECTLRPLQRSQCIELTPESSHTHIR